jgi:hypothetical protein
MPDLWDTNPERVFSQPGGESERSRPELWDTNPGSVFSPRGEAPDPAPSGQDDHSNEVRLKDDRGRLRLPAYVLIALGMALGVVLLVAVGVMIAPG